MKNAIYVNLYLLENKHLNFEGGIFKKNQYYYGKQRHNCKYCSDKDIGDTHKQPEKYDDTSLYREDIEKYSFTKHNIYSTML